MSNRFWKFEFADALGDIGAFTPTEIATLRYLCDRADEKGKCYPTLKTINEACGRHEKYDCGKHIKKAEALGFLTIGGHGRKRTYFLNTSVKGIKSAVKSADTSKSAPSPQQVRTPKSAAAGDKSALWEDSSPQHGRTNTSIDTSIDTPPSKPKESGVKNLIKEEMKAHPSSPDWKPSKCESDYFPDIKKEAEGRYRYLISKGMKADQSFGDVDNWFIEWVKDNEDNLNKTLFLMLNFQEKVSDLTTYRYWEKKKKLDAVFDDFEDRAGFRRGEHHYTEVLESITKRHQRIGKEVVLL